MRKRQTAEIFLDNTVISSIKESTCLLILPPSGFLHKWEKEQSGSYTSNCSDHACKDCQYTMCMLLASVVPAGSWRGFASCTPTWEGTVSLCLGFSNVSLVKDDTAEGNLYFHLNTVLRDVPAVSPFPSVSPTSVSCLPSICEI